MDWTHIYYRLGTSTATLNKYVNRLLRDGLMSPQDRESDNKRLYSVTSKGVCFIEAYIRMLTATSNLAEAEKEMEIFREDLLPAREPLLR